MARRRRGAAARGGSGARRRLRRGPPAAAAGGRRAARRRGGRRRAARAPRRAAAAVRRRAATAAAAPPRSASRGARCARAAPASTGRRSGAAALTSASSSCVRASAPSLIASQRRGEQVEQPHDVGARPTRAGLLGQPRVALGVTRSSAGTSPSVCTTSSSRAWRLEVAQELAGSRPVSSSARRGQQRRARVAGGDRVERAEQQVGVGDAEHREHVVERRSSGPRT